MLAYTLASLVPVLLTSVILAALARWLPWITSRRLSLGVLGLVLFVGIFTVPVYAWLSLAANVALIEVISAI